MPNHMIQYAVIGSARVEDTDAMSDAEIRHATVRSGQIDRYHFCPACREWTTDFGVLRAGLPCPAVQRAVAEGRTIKYPGYIEALAKRGET